MANLWQIQELSGRVRVRKQICHTCIVLGGGGSEVEERETKRASKQVHTV